jgi:hypothetical protein
MGIEVDHFASAVLLAIVNGNVRARRIDLR